jgi:hypothetical protein
VAAARALMGWASGDSTHAKAYWTWMGGVVTCRAVEPGGQPAPGPGGGAGRVQQTTSPSSSVPLSGQLGSAGRSGRPGTLASRYWRTAATAAVGPAARRDAPASAAASAAVCASPLTARLSPTSTTRAANPSSSVSASATTMATLPRSPAPSPASAIVPPHPVAVVPPDKSHGAS